MKFEWEVSIFTRNVIFIVGIIILAIVYYFVFIKGGVGNFNSLRALNWPDPINLA